MSALLFRKQELWTQVKKFRVLMCGDRKWYDRLIIREVCQCIRRERTQYPASITVIHGAAPGADTMAGEEADALGFLVEDYPADWTKYRKGAGPIRNKQMLVEGLPQIVIAFHHDLASSKGTANMINQAKAAGLPWINFDSRENQQRNLARLLEMKVAL